MSNKLVSVLAVFAAAAVTVSTGKLPVIVFLQFSSFFRQFSFSQPT